MASMNTRLNIKKLDENIGAQGDREAEVFQVNEQEKEYQTRLKIQTGNVLDSCNQRSIQQCMKSGVAKHLGVARIQQQNGLVNETNVTLFAKVTIISDWIQEAYRYVGGFGWLTSIKQGMLEPVKVKCIFLGYYDSIVGNKLRRLDDVTSKVVLYMNMGFNESGESMKTFIGSGVVGLQEVQTQDLVYYHSARDRKRHSAWELFSYREDSNEAAFAVVAVYKIYAYESLDFNNTVACEVISKWKAGLKDDMDARSDVYVLRNGCRKCSDDNSGYYREYTPAKGNVLGMEIVRDESGNTLRVSQSRFYNRKLVQTLLEGHSILSLESSLSGDCNVEKNGKWSCIYAVRSQEYQMVCTRLDITTAYVGMLEKFDRGLQTDINDRVRVDDTGGSLKANLQHMEALSTTEARYVTFTKAWKKEIWLKRLLTELTDLLYGPHVKTSWQATADVVLMKHSTFQAIAPNIEELTSLNQISRESELRHI
ncbi:hypothetical protein Tco_0137965 [Tanacetum coccineum]